MVIRRTMAEKRFSGAPFGSQKVRFDVSAVYPEWKKTGCYTQVPYCKRANSEIVRRLGPGTYNSSPGDFSPSVLERKASTPGWKRAEETEKLSGMPHLLYKETWERNRLLKENMGPGRYNIMSFVEIKEKKPSSMFGVCGTKDVRFKEDIKECNPGPGTYGNPHQLMEERASKSASTKGIMDSETSRCSTARSSGCDLGPGTYNLKSSIDETLKHTVSKRGPYDLFTGSRSQPIPYGHFATPIEYCRSEPGQYKTKTLVDDLESDCKRKHGKFGKISQYPTVPSGRIFYSSLAHCPRPQDSPGPGAYDTTKPLFASVRRSSAPFLTSAKRFERKSCRLLFGSTNPVGVGRYDISKPVCGKTATSYQSPFLSKTGRYLSNLERDKALTARVQKSHTAMPKLSASITANEAIAPTSTE
ncbi:ciliary microtubule-associated protein 2 [Mixophyes fleayi]|uniref:ciliary microtubule-associated protein 2 n=1 Tax=Mixophyes fleayi TaxID=3061075 RepID=UPI003F4DA4C5